MTLMNGVRLSAPARGSRVCLAVVFLVGGQLLASHSAHAALPSRGMELVTKGDGNFGDVRRVMGATDAGDQVVSISTASGGLGNSSLLLSAVVASRSDAGWSLRTGDPITPQLTGGGQRVVQTLAASTDFSKLLVITTADLVPADADNGGPDLYLVDVGTGAVTFLSGDPGTIDTVLGADPHFVGASRDLSRIYFTNNNEGLVGGPPGALYEWHDGTLSVASVRPDSTPSSDAPVTWAHSRSGFDANNFAPAARLAHGGPHAVSDDGSTVFFSGIYARKNGTTVQISASKRSGGPTPTAPAAFVGASHDGDAAYFTSADQLTDAATPGGGLYRYTMSTDTLLQLTPDAGDPAGLGATDANMSDDASHVYFVATAALAPGAQAGATNVYVYSNGSTRLVASTPVLGATVQRVSRDGRFAVIQTAGSLGGAANNGHVALYEYDEQRALVVCISCRADGSPSQGDATVDDNAPAGISSFQSLSSPRNITDDGHVFFASSDKLVPGDVTSTWDVYEYGAGSLALLTTGRSQYDSYVADNSDDGRNAFFVTRSSLVPEDDDELIDLYDARIGGGFPQPAPVETAPCAVDCQTPAPPPPIASSATSTLQDPGNLDEQPALTPKPATVSVTPAKAAAGTKRVLRVKVSEAGAIRLSGTSLSRTSRSVIKAGTYSVTASLTSAGKSSLKRKHTLKVTVTVAFATSGGTSASKRVTLTFKEPRASGARSGHATSGKEDR